MNLRELQTNFQHVLLDSECIGADWVRESAHGLTSRERLDIYHNAYRIRLIDVLWDTFEHTAVYLGDDWFQQLAAAYVLSHQSIHTNIGLYGQEFPRFLAEQLADDKEVSELALMDWKLRRAFDGADSAVMTHDDLQQLASVESGNPRLQPVPTLSISTQHYNTLDIWHAINQDQQPPVVEQLQQPVDILIWRKGHSPHFRSLTTIESLAIACVCSGDTIDAIGAALEKDFPDVDVTTEFGVMLNRWIGDEIIIRDK
ncbi:MAG: DNA-binding domain-containing protein [Gammaproteobacteria bacterium]|nr:DNA-binding domain-containing protein [Gammaproteobacteria bacterium]